MGDLARHEGRCDEKVKAIEQVDRAPRVLPTIGYGAPHMAELEATINAVPCDTVVFGTPVDLRRLLTLRHAAVRVRYEVQEIGRPTLADVLPNPLVKKVPTA